MLPSSLPPAPDPSHARSGAHYVELVHQLKLSSGLTYRQLARATARAGQPIPHSTIASTLARDRLPREDFLVAVVRACGCDAATVDRWLVAHRRLAQQNLLTRAELHVPAVEQRDARPTRRTRSVQHLYQSVHGQSLLALIIGFSAGLAVSSAAQSVICPYRLAPTQATLTTGSPVHGIQDGADGVVLFTFYGSVVSRNESRSDLSQSSLSQS